jgi:predicted DCC family thiol-disulfide oxidoreductase YuxK
MNTRRPILLYNDECGICRHIAQWVRRSAPAILEEPVLTVRPIGDDPQALERLHPGLSIWDAYAVIHLLMPDGSMKLGGEAVAEVLRELPSCSWFAWTFALRVLGFRPFQWLLNIAYAVLADIRPLLGCESCGTPSLWMKPFVWTVKKAKALGGQSRHPRWSPTFTPRGPAGKGRP